jgi:hypothetical protein
MGQRDRSVCYLDEQTSKPFSNYGMQEPHVVLPGGMIQLSLCHHTMIHENSNLDKVTNTEKN